MAGLSIPVEVVGLFFPHLRVDICKEEDTLLQCGLVSKQWNEQSRVVLFRTIHLNQSTRFNRSRVSLSQRVRRLIRIICAPTSTIPTASVKQVVLAWVHLQPEDAAALAQLWIHFPQLLALHLHNVQPGDTEKNFTTAFAPLAKLRSLEIQGNFETLSELAFLVAIFTDLKSIGFDNVTWSANHTHLVSDSTVGALRVSGSGAGGRSCLIWALRQARFRAVSELVVGVSTSKEIRELRKFLLPLGNQLKMLTLEDWDNKFGLFIQIQPLLPRYNINSPR